MKKSRVNT